MVGAVSDVRKTSFSHAEMILRYDNCEKNQINLIERMEVDHGPTLKKVPVES